MRAAYTRRAWNAQRYNGVESRRHAVRESSDDLSICSQWIYMVPLESFDPKHPKACPECAKHLAEIYP